LQAEVIKKFPNNENVRYTAVGGFLFLRFFAPAILGPKLFGIIDEYIEPKISRTLTLIAKTIQNLANLIHFGEKEPYMMDMNTFIDSQITSMKKYINTVSVSIEKIND